MNIDTSRTLLLIVDVQNGFVNNQTEHVINPINLLIKQWESFNASIVFSRFINPENGPWERFRDWHECKSEPDILLHPKLNNGNNLIIEKFTSSAWGDDLVQLCANQKLDMVMLCGIDTNECVLATAIDIFDAGLRPVVVRDACASASGESFHDAALMLLERLIGQDQIIESADL